MNAPRVSVNAPSLGGDWGCSLMSPSPSLKCEMSKARGHDVSLCFISITTLVLPITNVQYVFVSEYLCLALRMYVTAHSGHVNKKLAK